MRIELVEEFTYSSEDSRRIIDQTRDACERLNNYLMDFIETRTILLERRESWNASGNRGKTIEVNESLAYVENKINEVKDSMKFIAEDMPELVKINCGR